MTMRQVQGQAEKSFWVRYSPVTDRQVCDARAELRSSQEWSSLVIPSQDKREERAKVRLGSQSIGLRPEQSTMPRSTGTDTGTGMAVQGRNRY